MKNRIYLSGPITGVADYKAEFNRVEKELMSKGYDKIVNPANLDLVFHNGEYEDYMQLCIELLDRCNYVIMLDGWEKSAGANREMGYALAKNMVVVEYKDMYINEGCIGVKK